MTLLLGRFFLTALRGGIQHPKSFMQRLVAIPNLFWL